MVRSTSPNPVGTGARRGCHRDRKTVLRYDEALTGDGTHRDGMRPLQGHLRRCKPHAVLTWSWRQLIPARRRASTGLPRHNSRRRCTLDVSIDCLTGSGHDPAVLLQPTGTHHNLLRQQAKTGPSRPASCAAHGPSDVATIDLTVPTSRHGADNRRPPRCNTA